MSIGDYITFDDTNIYSLGSDIYKNTDAMNLAKDPIDTSEFEQQFLKIHGVPAV